MLSTTELSPRDAKLVVVATRAVAVSLGLFMADDRVAGRTTPAAALLLAEAAPVIVARRAVLEGVDTVVARRRSLVFLATPPAARDGGFPLA